MNCLLDTHAFLWAAFDPKKLTRRVHAVLTDPENRIFVSAVTFWEISLKFALAKIELEGVSPEDLPDTSKRMGFELIPMEPEEAAAFHRLPRQNHKDPFDRMLVHQAIRRHSVLISADTRLAQYSAQGLRLLW